MDKLQRYMTIKHFQNILGVFIVRNDKHGKNNFVWKEIKKA